MNFRKLIPTLEVVNLERVLPHEDTDPLRSELLVGSISRDGVQRHPVILGKTNRSTSLLLLDGANRINALKALGCRDVVAQIVNYEDPIALDLSTWLHLAKLEHSLLLKVVKDWANCHMHEVTLNMGIQEINRGQALAILHSVTGKTFLVRSNRKLIERVETLRKLTALYSNTPVREAHDGIPPQSDIRDLFTIHDGVNICIGFSALNRGDILTLIYDLNTRVPAGITRFILNCGRVLNVNVPLEMLHSTLGEGDKTRQLQRLLAEYHPRLHKESTIMFENEVMPL